MLSEQMRSRSATSRLATTAALVMMLVPRGVAPIAAQPSVTLGLSAGMGTFTGRDFAESPPGPTLGGGVHLSFGDSIEAGFLVDYSHYGTHGLIGATRQLDYLATLRIAARRAPLAMLVGAKLGFSRRSFEVVGEPARTEGFVIGPSFSLRVPVGPTSAVDLSVDALYHTYEELILYSTREYGSDQDGFRIVLRVGFLVLVKEPHR